MSAIRSVLSLLAGVALLMLGNGALGTLVSMRLSADGFGSLAVGVVSAAFFAGLTAGSLFAHAVIGRVGHIRAFSAFASIVSAASLAHAIAVDPVFWAVLRLIEGFCMAGLYMCIESWLNDKATNETRGQLLSVYMVTLYLAVAAGQQMLNLDDPTRVLVFMLISITLSLALVPVALTRTSPPTLPDVASFGFARLYAASPLGVAGVFVSGMVLGAVYGLAPVFGTQSGFGVSGTALFMSVLILGGVLLQWPLGRLSDRYDRRSVIIGLSFALALVSLGMIAAAGLGSPRALLPVALLFGGLCFTLYPLCLAHTNDHLDRSELVAASGGLILANSVGATFGPMLGSAAMTALGPSGLFTFIAVIGAAGGAFGVWRTRIRPPVPPEARGRFHAVPQTTPAVTPLDPRGKPGEQGGGTARELPRGAAGHAPGRSS